MLHTRRRQLGNKDTIVKGIDYLLEMISHIFLEQLREIYEDLVHHIEYGVNEL